MLKVENQIKRLAAFTSVVLMATAEALAQENLAQPSRRIVVSIPDRKLALLEAGQVVKIFSTAVGAPKAPVQPAPMRSFSASPTPPGIPKAKSFLPEKITRSARAGWA